MSNTGTTDGGGADRFRESSAPRSLQQRFESWMHRHASAPWAHWALGIVSFTEASFFPIPPSTFMLAMITLGRERRWVYLAVLTTVTSVLGGLFGYLVGSFLYDTLGQWIIESYGLAEDIVRIGALYDEHAFLALFIAALTPIPYKAFTISAGFFGISVGQFIVASLLGRGLRFFAVGFLSNVLGSVSSQKVFGIVSLVTLAAIVIIILFSFGALF